MEMCLWLEIRKGICYEIDYKFFVDKNHTLTTGLGIGFCGFLDPSFFIAL